MAAADASLSTPPVRRARPSGAQIAPLGFGLLAASYISGLILLPIAALVWKAQGLGLGGLWDAISAPDARSAFELTIVCSLIVVVVNAIFGTMLAWTLERDEFIGKRFVNALIDLPFALPTIVAGLTLIALYGQQSPIGINIAYTRTAIVVALAFVTLPFVVRSVQPVLRELDRESEQAATSLGASSFVTFRRVILPALDPRDRERLQPRVREGGRRVRLDRPDQRQHPAQDAGRVGGDLRPPREQRRERRDGARGAAARDLARRAAAHRLPRADREAP